LAEKESKTSKNLFFQEREIDGERKRWGEKEMGSERHGERRR
jgi:hypothetical protein